jgi:ketosteroid isomerase-like protein
MSQERAMSPQGAPDRDMLDQLQVWMPGLLGLIAAGVFRARLGSQLRRRLVNWSVKRGFAAMNRSDVGVVVLFYEPDAEVWMRGMAGVGIRDSYLGHEGIRELYADLDAAFSDWSYAIRAVVDLDDRVAVRADFLGRGRGSGAATTLKDVGTIVNFSARRKVARQDWFVESGGWRQALEAVGLSE